MTGAFTLSTLEGLMVLDRFNELILKVHAHNRFSPSDKAYVRDTLPGVLGVHRTIHSFRAYQHPSGIKVAGAPSRSFLKAYSLLLGKKAFGTRRFTGHPLYDDFEISLTIGIMRSHFEGGNPKGFYCCKICSLAIFPLLELDLLHHLTGGPLTRDMRPRIERREGAFAKGPTDRLVEFTLSF